MSNLSDNINDDLKTTNPKAYHWREMYLRQVDLYDSILKVKKENYEKLIAEKEEKYEKLIAEKDERLAENNKLITFFLSQKN